MKFYIAISMSFCFIRGCCKLHCYICYIKTDIWSHSKLFAIINVQISVETIDFTLFVVTTHTYHKLLHKTFETLDTTKCNLHK